MKKRHSAEQVVGILREAEKAGSLGEFCRQQGISEQTYYRWKRKYGGLSVTEARRIKQLEEENGRLKRLVGEQALGIQALQEVLKKTARL